MQGASTVLQHLVVPVLPALRQIDHDAFCHIQLKDDEERLEDEEAENRKRLKSAREHHKNWEQNRDGRVGTWRNFVDKKSKSKKVMRRHRLQT